MLGLVSAALVLSPTRLGTNEPPFPGTRDPQQILANLAAATPYDGFFGGRVAGVTELPRIRRLIEVEDDIDQKDFYLLELESASGKYLGIAAIGRDGHLRQAGAGDGVTEPEPTHFVADLARVQRVIGPRYGASRARYVIGLTTIDISQLFFPTIVADSPGGTLFVTHRLDVFRETERIPRSRRTDDARRGLAVPNIGEHVYVTRGGDLLVLEHLGTVRYEDGKGIPGVGLRRPKAQ